MFEPDKIKVGISACLIGEKVRYDGGHKTSNFCKNQLSKWVTYVPVCPEMAIGMGTPRKTIRLVEEDQKIHVRATDGSFDVTEKMEDFSAKKTAELDYLSGYIVCAKSPSCGMERVSVFRQNPKEKWFDQDKAGVGVFTRNLMERYPLLPVEENGRLNDTHLRENFVTRVLAYHDWMQLKHAGFTRQCLIDFHSRYKYLLMAHQPSKYRELGPILADIQDIEETAEAYFTGFMTALKTPCTRKNHTSVLQHLQGYFKKQLNSSQKQLLASNIDKYRRGLLPLMVPVTLIRQYLNDYPNEYLSKQVYLQPHPEELSLRYDH